MQDTKAVILTHSDITSAKALEDITNAFVGLLREVGETEPEKAPYVIAAREALKNMTR